MAFRYRWAKRGGEYAATVKVLNLFLLNILLTVCMYVCIVWLDFTKFNSEQTMQNSFVLFENGEKRLSLTPNIFH